MKFKKQPPRLKPSDLSAYDFNLTVFNLRDALESSRMYFNELGETLSKTITERALTAAYYDGAEAFKQYWKERLEQALADGYKGSRLIELTFGEDE